MRENLILTSHLHVLARLGAGAFSSITGEVVQPLLAIWSEGATDGATFIAFDMSSLRDQNPRDALSGSRYSVLGQGAQLDHPESRIILSEVPDLPMLAEYADAYAGIQAGDLPRFGRLFWELPAASAGWAHWQGTVESTVPFSGRQQIFQWEDGVGAYYQYLVDRLGVTGTGAWMRGREGWGKRGVTVSQMGDLPCTLYLGDLWDPNCAAVIPKDPQDLPAIWAYCSSGEFSRDVRRIDQSLKVTNKTLVKVPFDRPYWRKVAADTFPEGLPEPSSDDPKQWLFNGGVRSSWFPLQVAVARLLGFRWPDQQPDDLDQWADDDGIVCLPAVGGETPGEQRLRGLLASAYGDAWSPAVLDSLLVDAGGKPGDLEGWLRKVFFKDHCKVFANRPFIWQIWDGTPDGFSALINYHRLDRRLLERLIYSYLGSWWMERQRDEVHREVPGAEARLAAAQQLKQKLEQILIGEPPFDIFVRWKTLAEQPIGWEPDLDDGVRLNIRPFMTAGVLRFNPNIKWNKDRGKNPDGSERLNDLHFARAEKETARREAGR